MKIPIVFPSEADKIHQEAMEFRQLNSTERFRRILGLCAFAEAISIQSPNREQALALRNASEEEWKRIHRELFKRHGY